MLCTTNIPLSFCIPWNPVIVRKSQRKFGVSEIELVKIKPWRSDVKVYKIEREWEFRRRTWTTSSLEMIFLKSDVSSLGFVFCYDCEAITFEFSSVRWNHTREENQCVNQVENTIWVLNSSFEQRGEGLSLGPCYGPLLVLLFWPIHYFSFSFSIIILFNSEFTPIKLHIY